MKDEKDLTREEFLKQIKNLGFPVNVMGREAYEKRMCGIDENTWLFRRKEQDKPVKADVDTNVISNDGKDDSQVTKKNTQGQQEKPYRAYTICDAARVHGNTPPFEEDELFNGYLTIKPGTIYLGRVRWWQYTDDPKVIFCTICQTQVTNYYLAINHHVQNSHTPDQI